MKMRTRKRYINAMRRGIRFGKRCRGFEPACIVCASWAFYDEHKRFPNFDEALARAIEAAYGIKEQA